MKTITVPDIGKNPINLDINGSKYHLFVGETTTVPDEVAEIVEKLSGSVPVPVRETRDLFPVSATGEMTQPVGRDNAGNLFTQPPEPPAPFPKGAAVEDATSETLLTQFNALLDSLRDAGLIETAESS